MAKRRQPILGNSELAERLCCTMRSRLLFANISEFLMGPTEEHDLERQGNVVRVKFFGVEQFWGFEDRTFKEGSKERQAFYVQTPSLNSEGVEDAEGFIASRIAGYDVSTRNKFRRVYGDVVVGVEEKDFGDERHEGLTVVAPIKRFLLGRNGKLSENFFVQGYNAIALPTFRMAAGGEQPEPGIWHGLNSS